MKEERTNPLNYPSAPLPVCEDKEIEADFEKLPVGRILDQLTGYSQYTAFSVSGLSVPDVYTDYRPEVLHDAMLELVFQLRDLLPGDAAGAGELACQYCLELLDGLHRCMAVHTFKLGYLFGCRRASWSDVTVYTAEGRG